MYRVLRRVAPQRGKGYVEWRLDSTPDSREYLAVVTTRGHVDYPILSAEYPLWDFPERVSQSLRRLAERELRAGAYGHQEVNTR